MKKLASKFLWKYFRSKTT